MSNSSLADLANCSPMSRSHYPFNSEFKEKKEELTQRAAPSEAAAAIIAELISVPEWLPNCRAEKKHRKTAALVAVYCKRWPLSTIPLWIEISASEDLTPRPRSRAAWLYSMLREYAGTREPVNVEGHQLRWQAALLEGRLDQAREFLRQRRAYLRSQTVLQVQTACKAYDSQAAAQLSSLGGEVPELADAMAELRARSAAL